MLSKKKQKLSVVLKISDLIDKNCTGCKSVKGIIGDKQRTDICKHCQVYKQLNDCGKLLDKV